MAWCVSGASDTLPLVADRQFDRATTRLGDVIRKRRRALRLTQEDAAEKIGIASRHYQKLEAGSVNVTLLT